MENGMKKFLLGAVLLLSVLYPLSSVLAVDPDEAVVARQEIFKNIGKEMKALGAIAKGDVESERAALIDSATQMRNLSGQPWTYFGQETAVARVKTEAKSTIWADPAGFRTAQQNFANAAQELSLIAAKGTPDQVREKINALGATCGACHKAFKN